MSSLDIILEDSELRQDVIKSLGRSDLPQQFGYDPSDIQKFLSDLQYGEEVPAGKSDYEAIILLVGRPVLEIVHNTYTPPISKVWHQKLSDNRKNIEKAIPSVGRIELREHPDYEWVGTGWLVRDDVVVTNRHVAEAFAHKQGDDFVFSLNPNGRTIGARIDFREEYRQPEQIEFRVKRVLHIEPRPGADVAFLKVATTSQVDTPLTPAIPLASEIPNSETDVVVIGYPAWDGRRNDPENMKRIFRNIYKVKRLAPGKVSLNSSRNYVITHDCSTLGGNSGSVVLDIETGKAVGLHYAGRYKKTNYAVTAVKVAQLLEAVL